MSWILSELWFYSLHKPQPPSLTGNWQVDLLEMLLSILLIETLGEIMCMRNHGLHPKHGNFNMDNKYACLSEAKIGLNGCNWSGFLFLISHQLFFSACPALIGSFVPYGLVVYNSGPFKWEKGEIIQCDFCSINKSWSLGNVLNSNNRNHLFPKKALPGITTKNFFNVSLGWL